MSNFRSYGNFMAIIFCTLVYVQYQNLRLKKQSCWFVSKKKKYIFCCYKIKYLNEYKVKPTASTYGCTKKSYLVINKIENKIDKRTGQILLEKNRLNSSVLIFNDCD